MGSISQFVAFFCICCLIRCVVTDPNQKEDIELNNKYHSNPNIPIVGDFYFDEQKTNDDNVKTGRTISQSAWSKEDKEQTQPVKNKTNTEVSDEFAIKNLLSYLLNVVQELKKDIFGIKEMTSLKSTEKLKSSQDNFENKNKQIKVGENPDTPRPDDSIGNSKLRKENQQPKSNYITDYYEKNGIKTIGDETEEEDLENSSDVSDDSSHKPNVGTDIKVISKNNENNPECIEVKRKPDTFLAEKAINIPTNQTELPEGVQEFDKKKENRNGFKRSTTKTEQKKLKESEEKIENVTIVPPTSKTGKREKKNNNSSNNVKEKNKSTEKPLKSANYEPTKSPQNESNVEEKSNQTKSTDYRNSKDNSKNQDGSTFDKKSDILVISTTPDSNGETVPYASVMSSGNPEYGKQQEQITSPKADDQRQTQSDATFLSTDRINEHTTQYSQSQKAVSEFPNYETTTEAYVLDSEIIDDPTESKGKKNEPDTKIDKQKTSNNYDVGNTIAPTSSGNSMSKGNLDKDPSYNLSNKEETNENDDSEESKIKQQDKNGSETQGDSSTEQTKAQELNDDSEEKTSLKSKQLNDSNTGNIYNKEDDNLATTATDLSSFQDSNHEAQNHDVKASEKYQENQKINENLNKNDEIDEISPDEEYEFEDHDDFDISDELNDMRDFNQNSTGRMNINNGNYEDNEETNSENTTTYLINESQISPETGYITEEKSGTQEQYDTFLEYFYKHSNSSFFQFLKNH